MYRDLSAQLAAKEDELAAANEEIAKLRLEVERARAEALDATDAMGNRDAVLKNSQDRNEELTARVRELGEELQSARLKIGRLERELKQSGGSLLGQIVSVFESLSGVGGRGDKRDKSDDNK